MSAKNFTTHNSTYRQLMGNGLTYRVPRFQRDYSWGENEWEDLWLDVLGTVMEGGEPAHYMGYLVLQSVDEKTFAVIDGQQRLTTLSILVLATLKNLERLVHAGQDADDNRTRLDELRRTFIGFLDPETLVSRSKLSLNRNNDRYYQDYLVPLRELPAVRLRASENAMRRSFEFFDRKVRENFQGGSPEIGPAIARFASNLSDRLFFTSITVDDDLNAYKVFETLNARGVRLSATDLLKNHLFSILDREGRHDHELRTLEDRWDMLVGRMGAESFPEFLRTHWNSRNKSVRQSDIFKAIRGEVRTSEQAFILLRKMEDDADPYLALIDPQSSGWAPASRALAGNLKTFGVRQHYPLLLAARRKFSDSDFESILRVCVAISFRWNVIAGFGVAEQERAYGAAAVAICVGELGTASEVVAALAPIYLSDSAFKSAFAEKSIRTTDAHSRRIVRYILCAIEKHVSGGDHDFASQSFNIEHVLPLSAVSGWELFSNEQVDAMVFRLGNMTLMAAGSNSDCGNESFATKKPFYASSAFSITKKIAEENAEWTPERLAARQVWMANQATAIWRVPQLPRD